MAVCRQVLRFARNTNSSFLLPDLQVLATDPVRQREGAGTLLLKWAAEKIDSNGVRGMLEASSIAVQYGVYEKQGFRAVDEHTYVDKQRFSTAKPLTLVTMVREKRSD